jgi:acetylornithine deacetylase/succinyl-diaminopimelate desuccinylase-like protein
VGDVEATESVAAEVTELLRQLIRNRCVNDGTVESGGEIRNADLLRSYLEGSGLDLAQYEPEPGRASLVARIEGSDPRAPTLCLMGHTDVVPVTPSGWTRDPFGGELVDGEVWGRGAVDMLNLTASMAVALRRLASSGWRPRGTLVYFAVADEEAAGVHGAEWVTVHQYDAVRSDYVLTESGGILRAGPTGPTVTLTTGEKGVAWRRLRVRGTPGHGSMPYGSDNALVKAAQVVTRLSEYRPGARITDAWRAYAETLDLPEDIRAALVDGGAVDAACSRIEDPRLAKLAHACTHMTFSPNVVHGGVKTNVIPDAVAIDVDIRTLPGQGPDDVRSSLDEALGPLSGDVEVEVLHESLPTSSPWDTPLRELLERVTRREYPEAALVPRLTAGGTDARFFRDRGAVAYGFGLFSPAVTFEDFSSRFHGNDERVDVESLRLSTQMWIDVATELLG